MNYRAKIAMLLVIAVLTACRPEKTERIVLNAKMENVVSEADSTKTFLSEDEKWVYWELGDRITVCQGSDTLEFAVDYGSGSLQAAFSSEVNMEQHPNVMVATPNYLFSPSNLDPKATNAARTSWNIRLPRVHPYRTTSDPDPDHSFSSSVLPMVAFSPDVLSAEDFYFHPVSGILRLQFYSSSATAVTIDSITIDSKSKISGLFNMPATNAAGLPSIQDPEPYIVPGDPEEGDSTITITGINKPVGGYNQDKLYTFYVPLPATKDLTASYSSPSGYYTKYRLRVTIHGTRSSDNVPMQCVKILEAQIHRCNITKMRALDLESFSVSGNGTATPQLVGNGTEERPFQIYTYDDLLKVRQAFELQNPKINGQLVRGMGHPQGPTYFMVCRSGIEIPADGEWNTAKGIKNFKGYMYRASTSSIQNDIINNSRYSLFETISDSGKVEGLYMGGDVTVAVRRDEYSPFCHINNGLIKDCHNSCDINIDIYNSGSHAMHLAGICATNYGTIDGCANSGDLRSDSSYVAGVCYYNYGTIRGGFTLSHATSRGLRNAGICYYNAAGATVQECIVSSSTNPSNASGSVGVIVFENHGTISDCRTTGSMVYSSLGSVGGICNTNYGIVRNCSNTVSMVGCNTSVGGIVAFNEAGEVYNCNSGGNNEISGSDGDRTATYGGGIVGWLRGGKIVNCYNQCRVVSPYNAGGIVGKIEMEEYLSDLSQRPVQNCWSAYGLRLHGFIYDTICKVGNSCFSSSVGDIDTLFGCNIFNTTNYHIDTIQQSYYTYTGGTIGVGSTLVAALNYWVNTEDPSHSKYWSWSVNPGENVPHLAPSNGKRGTVTKTVSTNSATRGSSRPTAMPATTALRRTANALNVR